jgi:uncharacterized damage-inducible protein DinB
MEADLRYPIGKFQRVESLTDAERRAAIDAVAEAPAKFRAAIAGLNERQLDTPYRPSGWTVRQVIHHVPDSHLNAYIRFKLALTEDTPTIKTYAEARWAELGDVKATPVEVSLSMLDNLHERWVLLLRSLSPEDWTRKFRHPELGTMTLDQNLQLYAWHGRHHAAHITSLRERNGWR